MPYLALFFSGLVLINVKSTSKLVRLTLAVVMVVSLSMMNGARPLTLGDPNDIDGYYHIYQMLSQNNLGYLTHFGGGLESGGGVEVGLPLLLYFFSILLPALTVNGLMFFISLFCAFLVMVWVEITFYSKDSNQSPALIGVSILMLNLYLSTQLTRQYIALIILLFSFASSGQFRQWTYVILAATFHLTAIPFYFMYKLIKAGYIGCLIIFSSLLIFSLFFSVIGGYVDIFPAAIIEKFAYNIASDQSYTAADFASMRMILLLCAISILVLCLAGLKGLNKAKNWLLVPWIGEVIHLILLPIPLASLRTTLIIHSILPGTVAYKMLASGGSKIGHLLTTVLNVLLVYKLFIYLLAENSGNLLPTVRMVDVFFTVN